MKNLTAFLLGLFTLIAFTACAAGGDVPAAEETPPDPPALVRTAAKLGIYTHATETGQQTMLQLQKQSMRDLTATLFTAEKPEDFTDRPLQAIAVNLPADSTGEPLLELARTKDLPLLFYGTKPSDKVLNSSEDLRFVGSRTEERGTTLGEIAMKLWDTDPALDKNGDGIMQCVLLGTGDGVPEYAVNVIEEAGVTTAVLAEEASTKETVTAASCLSAVLADKDTQVEMVLCSGETAATGAVMALQSAGCNTGEGDFIPIAAWGETAVLKKMADSGAVAGVAVPDSETEAALLLSMTVNLANEADMLEGLSVDYDPQTRTIPVPCKIYEGKVMQGD